MALCGRVSDRSSIRGNSTIESLSVVWVIRLVVGLSNVRVMSAMGGAVSTPKCVGSFHGT
ncbi:UNVERIFIED_CONTAM: hypothetical protein DES50_10832 [Williamsia faeni]